jgi:thiol-disulfide isomerase/thioredoxin
MATTSALTRHPARWTALTAGLVVAILSVVLALNVGTDPQLVDQSNRLLGRDAPAFNLVTVTGERVSGDSLVGKTVIVNFWNTWCRPCRQELPALNAFYQVHADDPDFAMVGIVRDAQESKTRIVEYVKRKGMNWIIAFDPGSRVALDFATRGQPETFAISPAGEVVGFQFATVTVPNLETLLAHARGQAR